MLKKKQKKKNKTVWCKAETAAVFLSGRAILYMTYSMFAQKEEKKKFLDSSQIYAVLLHVSRPGCTLYQGGTET